MTRANPANGYDLVLHVDALANVFDPAKGWAYSISDDADVENKLHDDAKVSVAVVGGFNVGKTWLLQHLCTDWPTASGGPVHTEGIGVKVSRIGPDFGLMCLDTAGFNSPVSVAMLSSKFTTLQLTSGEKLAAMSAMLEEAKRQEIFMRRVVLDLAQVCVLVLPEVMRNDVMDILSWLHQFEVLATTRREFVVVHNLRNMSYASFCNKGDDGKTYMERIATIFKLHGRQWRGIYELYNHFGVEGGAKVRHLFLTNDNVEGKNGDVINFIRAIIGNCVPRHGSIITDIGDAATRAMYALARFHPSFSTDSTVELRFHRERRRFVAGVVDPGEEPEFFDAEHKKREYAVVRTRQVFDDLQIQLTAVCAARDAGLDSGANAEALRDRFDKAKDEYEEALVKAMACPSPLRIKDASALMPPPSAVSMVALRGGINRKFTRRGAVERYNITRVKATVMEQPVWCTLVHIVLPGLQRQEVTKLQQHLRWNAGCTMEGKYSSSPETLRIKFNTTVLSMPEKQLASLNTYTSGAKGASVVTFKAGLEVIDVGSRGFALGSTEADQGTNNPGVRRVTVNLWTDVAGCKLDEPPRVSYARGVLTVAVVTKVSKSEHEGTAWPTEAIIRDASSAAAEDCTATDEDDIGTTESPPPQPPAPPTQPAAGTTTPSTALLPPPGPTTQGPAPLPPPLPVTAPAPLPPLVNAAAAQHVQPPSVAQPPPPPGPPPPLIPTPLGSAPAPRPSPLPDPMVTVTKYIGALQLVKDFVPTKSCADAMVLELGPMMPAVTQMQFIVSEAIKIAKDRLEKIPPGDTKLEVDQAVAVAAYTFDLGLSSKCPLNAGSDNFYVNLNRLLITRQPKTMVALRNYLTYLIGGLEKLPPVGKTVTFRGVDSSALAVVQKHYDFGASVHWSAFTSTSSDITVAKGFAGAGGIIFCVRVVRGFSICAYSQFDDREAEVLIMPNSKFVVIQAATMNADGYHYVELQQISGESLIY